jgi:hypothetical protein
VDFRHPDPHVGVLALATIMPLRAWGIISHHYHFLNNAMFITITITVWHARSGGLALIVILSRRVQPAACDALSD